MKNSCLFYICLAALRISYGRSIETIEKIISNILSAVATGGLFIMNTSVYIGVVMAVYTWLIDTIS